MLRLGAGATLGLLLAGCGGGGTGVSTTTPEGATRETTSVGAVGEAGAGTRGIVFNTGSKDVTLFDPATNRVTGSRPTGAVVRWLSNEQHYFDGESVWTYDYPEGEVLAIAIHPETFEVTRQVPTGGAGPGHSFVLTPDNRRGFVNAAESDFLAVVDPVAGEVVERVETGAYP
jgi:DNA-binding beta-propeller fold protein YncE